MSWPRLNLSGVTVTPGRMAVLDLYRTAGLVRWRRWRSGAGDGWSEMFITLGYLPDGRWWVESTGDIRIWVYAGADQWQVRAAARTQVGVLMRGRRWQRVIATYVPGVHPPQEAVVAEWPAGHEPPLSENGAVEAR